MKTFKPYTPDQRLLLPPALQDWLPQGHLALLVKLLIYAYCTGKPSSRRIEKATYEEVPYRVLAADQHPDHDTLAAFRQQHLGALAGLFGRVLALCRLSL